MPVSVRILISTLIYTYSYLNVDKSFLTHERKPFPFKRNKIFILFYCFTFEDFTIRTLVPRGRLSDSFNFWGHFFMPSIVCSIIVFLAVIILSIS